MRIRVVYFIHIAFMMSIVMYLIFGNFKGSFLHEGFISREMVNSLRLILSIVFCGELLSASFITRAIRGNSVMAVTEAVFLKAHIVRLAIYESGAIFGLFLNLAGGTFQDQLLFSVPALVLMLLAFPREDTVN